MTGEPYENTLSVETLRLELRRSWNEQNALVEAIQTLPVVPPTLVLRALSSAAMNARHEDYWALGKAMQREHGTAAVPPKTEYECAAGMWSRIREGLLRADGETSRESGNG